MNLRDLLFSSQGRIPRSTYWYYALAVAGIYIPFLVLVYTTSNADILAVTSCISGILSLVLFYPGLMVSIKRCHDRNRSGWFLLVSFIPVAILMALYGIILFMLSYDPGTAEGMIWIVGCMVWLSILPSLWVFIELAFLRGTVGPNKYGPDPLQVGMSGVAQYTPPPVQLTGELPGEALHPGGAKVCPYCGEVSLQDAIFCKACGKELPADSSE